MKLEKLRKRIYEIFKKNQRDQFEYFSLARDLNSLTLEEKKALISEVLNDEIITVKIQELIQSLKNLIGRFTGQDPETVNMNSKIRRSLTTIEQIRHELTIAMNDDDSYLGIFAIATIDMYLDVYNIYRNVFNTLDKFEIELDFINPKSEEEN